MTAEVVILDTSVLLNVLDVPGFNQKRGEIFQQFRALVDGGASLLLPMAAIFETGDHIADLSDGGLRRRYAKGFRDNIHEALDGRSPWVPTRFPDRPSLCRWLEDFPDHAMRGRGLNNLSIVKDWETACKLHQNRRVRIWSLNMLLQSYDRPPSTSLR